MINDILFRLTVYLIALYFIFTENSKYINYVGLIIFIAHLYKDITNLKKWPCFTEYIGLILGYILIYEGYSINNYFIIICGMLKFMAHIRQLSYNDNCYYY
jgi:hypothetical protein